MSNDLTRTLTLGDVLREHARSRPREVGIVDGDVRLTWERVDERVDRLSDALATAGVEVGDRLLWLGQNSFRLLELWLAAARLGAMVCPANWRQAPRELAFVIDDLQPRVVFWQEAEIGDRVNEARTLSEARGALWLQHDDRGAEGYERFLGSGQPGRKDREVDPDLPLLVIYTAAFAGSPNGSMLSQSALLIQSFVMAAMQRIDENYAYLACGPLHHVATWMSAVPTLHFGGTLVITPRVNAEELCRIIEKERCNGAWLTAPTIAEMVEVNRDRRYDLSSFRSAAIDPVWDSMATLDESPWGHRPGGYGQTEVTALGTFSTLGTSGQGSHGRTSPAAQLLIVDDDAKELPSGRVGEIVLRGPIVHNGYWNRPDLNRARSRNGWWHTGDMGKREVDGSVSFVGPKARLIKSAGENIYPAEVENCLEAHPGVREAAVIGAPDPRWSQVVKALVVLRDGHDVSVTELTEHCRAQISSYKKPQIVEFLDQALPRVNGIKDYAQLDARFGGGGYPGE
jgi:acyl-CoA synthetase (AMP-forming)/AMP-acid ligase II